MNPSRTSAVMLTKSLLQVLLICGAASFLIEGVPALPAAQSTNISNGDRKLKIKEVVDLPVRVREARNLQSETWPSDLEIEVENVSSKPIYFINAVLEFPDDPAPEGRSGIILEYGNPENLDIGRYANTEDEHLDPGKTCVLTVPAFYRKALLAKQQQTPMNLKRFELWFEIVSFGDGTGFQVDQFLDKRKKSQK